MNDFWRRSGKRIFDVSIALILVVMLWPLLLIVTILVRINLGSPILFTQLRLGKDENEFRLYKFRSMLDLYDANGHFQPDEQRLNPFGKFLRSTSIDELPQILNILRGEMSFIGPRATLPAYKDLLLARYPKRFSVLPGITSLPGIRGRNTLSWDEKFTMDVEYVEKFGFRMDLYIFLRTIPVVLGREGISMPGVETTTRYDDERNKTD
ncbi:sugar transferase [Alcaligenaceae bacterium]|nr:sugar transferase [Alcaligenaceae bacterium]